jgi:hypothetical protein
MGVISLGFAGFAKSDRLGRLAATACITHRYSLSLVVVPPVRISSHNIMRSGGKAERKRAFF